MLSLDNPLVLTEWFFFLMMLIMMICFHTAVLYAFNDPEYKAFRKNGGERRKSWKPAFSPFSTMFSTLSKKKIIILDDFVLSSANALNLDQSGILSFGKVYLLFPKQQNLSLVQIERICRQPFRHTSKHGI